MSFKTKKNKTTLQKIFLYSFIAFLGSFYIEPSIAGGATPDATYELKEALRKTLVKQGLCLNIEDCVSMSHEGSTKRIYLNLYDQIDKKLASHIVDFFIQEGIKITGGIPISFRVFPKDKEEYLGLRYTFGSNDYLIKLEINK